MRSFKSLVADDPSLLELLEYKKEQFEETMDSLRETMGNITQDLREGNVTRDRDRTYLEWRKTILEGKMDMLETEIRSVEYQIRHLKDIEEEN